MASLCMPILPAACVAAWRRHCMQHLPLLMLLVQGGRSHNHESLYLLMCPRACTSVATTIVLGFTQASAGPLEAPTSGKVGSTMVHTWCSRCFEFAGSSLLLLRRLQLATLQQLSAYKCVYKSACSGIRTEAPACACAAFWTWILCCISQSMMNMFLCAGGDATCEWPAGVGRPGACVVLAGRCMVDATGVGSCWAFSILLGLIAGVYGWLVLYDGQVFTRHSCFSSPPT
jgi:hypothetical protein